MKQLNWKEIIDQNSSLVQELFSKLSEDQLNLQPNVNTWSISQNLEHLIVINESYFPIINELHAQSYNPPFHSKISFFVNFFGKFVLNSVDSDRRKKIKTFPIWEPSKSNVAHGIINRFLQHQEELKRMIESTDSFITGNVDIHSPASKVIVYKLATAFDIIVTHETRHINQAKELLYNKGLN